MPSLLRWRSSQRIARKKRLQITFPDVFCGNYNSLYLQNDLHEFHWIFGLRIRLAALRASQQHFHFRTLRIILRARGRVEAFSFVLSLTLCCRTPCPNSLANTPRPQFRKKKQSHGLPVWFLWLRRIIALSSHYQSLQIVALLLQAFLLGSLALSHTLLLQQLHRLQQGRQFRLFASLFSCCLKTNSVASFLREK